MMRIIPRAVALLVLGLLAFGSQAYAKEKNNRLVFTFGGRPRTVYYYVPEDAGARPVVVLLHGSGRDGTEMLDAWRSLASAEHIILVAPNAMDPQKWDSLYDPARFLEAAVDQVKAIHAIDPRRIYLFGHSGGGVFALDMALMDSDYFAATAVHAGALGPENEHLFTYAERHMPIAIWVGDGDPFFPVARVAATKSQFEAHGFSVRMDVLKNHTHDYGEVSEKVDREAWEFLRGTELESPSAGEQP